MLTLKTILDAMRHAASYGEPHVPVPRDHCPPARYRRNRAKLRARCDHRSTVGVDDFVMCRDCGQRV